MDGQTDGQTDVGHINLIGGLVTRNPPKYVTSNYTSIPTKLLKRKKLNKTVSQTSKQIFTVDPDL